ncbi:hypothetical protein ILUMI_11168 [Ignelater luminosus]|uniref:MULE transposase domain-containing protein n=1 Tax=Ignelater luminosus TaxID=2038154 RepID=A0A8K0D100_IGNLU|nr:hypothetical protein ILUMI_11168 [Ignelater luminosus]
MNDVASLLTKKDLYNIEKAFHLNESSVRHANDAVSVDSCINELKGNGSILLYKQRDSLCSEYPELKQDDFCLDNNDGRPERIAIKVWRSIPYICVDGTHGLNGYGFELHTILILDGLREGYPTVFLISNRNDSKVMEIFFSYVEVSIGRKISSKVFMLGYMSCILLIIGKYKLLFFMYKLTLAFPNQRLIIDLNDKADVSKDLVMAISSNRSTSGGGTNRRLFEEQQKRLEILQQQICSTSSLGEIEAIEKIVAPIQPTLDAIQNKKTNIVSLLPMYQKIEK